MGMDFRTSSARICLEIDWELLILH